MAQDIQHQTQSLIKELDFTLSTSTRMAREGLEILKRVERNIGALQLSEYSREEALESFSEISQTLEALKTRHDSIEEKYTKMKQKLSKSIEDFSKFRKLCEAADPMGMRKQSDEHIRQSKVYGEDPHLVHYDKHRFSNEKNWQIRAGYKSENNLLTTHPCNVHASNLKENVCQAVALLVIFLSTVLPSNI